MFFLRKAFDWSEIIWFSLGGLLLVGQNSNVFCIEMLLIGQKLFCFSMVGLFLIGQNLYCFSMVGLLLIGQNIFCFSMVGLLLAVQNFYCCSMVGLLLVVQNLYCLSMAGLLHHTLKIFVSCATELWSAWADNQLSLGIGRNYSVNDD